MKNADLFGDGLCRIQNFGTWLQSIDFDFTFDNGMVMLMLKNKQLWNSLMYILTSWFEYCNEQKKEDEINFYPRSGEEGQKSKASPGLFLQTMVDS